MTAQSLVLNGTWLDMSASPTLANASNLNLLASAGYGYKYGDYWYPWYEPMERHYHHHSTVTVVRPIKLTMAEVERLRVAAKKDKDLKATLEKFTEHIEVVVDFEK